MSEQTVQPNQPKTQTSKAPFIVGATLTVASLGLLAYQSTKQQPAAPTESEPSNSLPSPVAQPTKTSTQPSNTYSAIGSYTSPAGPEEIGVTLSVDNGVVTDATVEVKATNEFSKKWQGVFQSNFKKLVIGKDIATLKLDAVSGSSLTPKGFNDAVEKIKTQLPT